MQYVRLINRGNALPLTGYTSRKGCIIESSQYFILLPTFRATKALNTVPLLNPQKPPLQPHLSNSHLYSTPPTLSIHKFKKLTSKHDQSLNNNTFQCGLPRNNAIIQDTRNVATFLFRKPNPKPNPPGIKRHREYTRTSKDDHCRPQTSLT